MRYTNPRLLYFTLHRQSSKVSSTVLSENISSLIFQSPIESPGDLRKDDIADDLE